MYQKPDEALQTYNTRYSSYFRLAYPELDLDDPLMRMHCIHYTSSLHGKLGDEMTGRFNQDLPKNLHAKTANFEPHIITKQSIHKRKVHEVNQINIIQFQNKVEMKHMLGTQITKAKTMTQITSQTGTSSIQPQTLQDLTTRMVTINTTLTTNPAPKETTTIAKGITTKRTLSKTNRLMYH